MHYCDPERICILAQCSQRIHATVVYVYYNHHSHPQPSSLKSQTKTVQEGTHALLFLVHFFDLMQFSWENCPNILLIRVPIHNHTALETRNDM